MLGTLDEEQIDHLLRSETVGRIGVHADGRTYVVPTTYVYDGDAIYGHAAEGLKVRMMRANRSVCFQVDRITDMANWRSVIAWGTYEELSGDVAVAAMNLLFELRLDAIPAGTSNVEVFLRSPRDGEISDLAAVAVVVAP